jgi:hypothetical protein
LNSLLGIQKTFVHNAGGMKSLYMSLVQDILSYRTPVGNVVPGGFKMVAGKLFLKFYFTPDSCSFSESSEMTAHGKVYTTKITFTFTSNDPAVCKQLDYMTREGFIIVGRDNNDNQRILGSFDSPAKFSFEYSTQSEIRNSSRYVCTFTQKANHSAYYFTGIFNQVVYNDGYSFGFLRTA